MSADGRLVFELRHESACAGVSSRRLQGGGQPGDKGTAMGTMPYESMDKPSSLDGLERRSQLGMNTDLHRSHDTNQRGRRTKGQRRRPAAATDTW